MDQLIGSSMCAKWMSFFGFRIIDKYVITWKKNYDLYFGLLRVKFRFWFRFRFQFRFRLQKNMSNLSSTILFFKLVFFFGLVLDNRIHHYLKLLNQNVSLQKWTSRYICWTIAGEARWGSSRKHTFWLCKPNIPIHPPLRDRKLASS